MLKDDAAPTRTKRGRGNNNSGGGGGGGKKSGRRKTPVKVSNKLPIVTLVRNDVGGRKSGEKGPNGEKGSNYTENRRSESDFLNADRRDGRGDDSTGRHRSESFSPDVAAKKNSDRTKDADDHNFVHEGGNDDDDDDVDDENFLRSKDLLVTPRKNHRKRSSSSPVASPQLPLANVINTPVDPPPRYGDGFEEEVIPDSYPAVAAAADASFVADATDADASFAADATDADATFLTPRRRVPAISQVLAPETPVAEMGLTYVEKAAIARRRLKEAKGKLKARIV